MIEPFLSDEKFLNNVRQASTLPPAFLTLWWLGQSGFLVQCGGKHLLIDPYLSDSLTEKYKNTDKPHVRMSRRVVDPAKLDFIDVVSSSHTHTDHLDPVTLQALVTANPKMAIVAPEANRAETAFRAGVDAASILGVNDGETVEAGGFKFTGIPAAHNAVERDALGQCKYMGYVIECGGWYSIYHSGDTLLYEGLGQTLKKYRDYVHYALLPINGDRPERRVSGNMDGVHAAGLARAIGARWVVPCHYDMFEFNTATTDDFERECKRLGQEYKVMRLGERLQHPNVRG